MERGYICRSGSPIERWRDRSMLTIGQSRRCKLADANWRLSGDCGSRKLSGIAFGDNVMGLFQSQSKGVRPSEQAPRGVGGESQTALENFYADLMGRRPELLDEKLKLHERIIDEFNLAALEKLSPEELTKQIRAYVGTYARSESLSLNQRELDIFANEIVAEMTGYGPIEPLLKDPTVTDILINTHRVCFVERFGKLQETRVHFKDEAHLLRIISKIVAGVGRRIDESSPMVDARLPDGSRVNVAIRPVAIDGPLVSIRKFSERAFDMVRLTEMG